MKKPASLNVVIEVSSRRRDDCLQALGQAQRELQQAELQLLQLQNYAQESQTRWRARASQGVAPALLYHHQTFMGKIDHAVHFQRGVIQRLQLNLQHCQQQVLMAERELASMNKFAERRHDAWQKQLERQEQKIYDEMAATVHRMHMAQHPTRQPV
ncbi:MAG: hypothetical protein RI959_2110 [Pseudomonadota bacterium]|jgi:flagellar FliJ protein